MRALLCLALVFAATGCCVEIRLRDDVKVATDPDSPAASSDELHTPYVVGATMIVQAENHCLVGGKDASRWSIESSDPSVFRVTQVIQRDEFTVTVQCRAAGPGSATIAVKDEDGDVLAAQKVTVGLPDEAVVLSHASLAIGRNDEAPTDTTYVLVDGTATFLVLWFAGGELLHGNGVLSAVPDDGLDITIPPASDSDGRDWLQVRPRSAGAPLGVQLRADGNVVRPFTVVPVRPAEVARLRLRGEDESKALPDHGLNVLAEGLDAQLHAVLGIEYQWKADGVVDERESSPSVGDLYSYAFHPQKQVTLAASFGTLDAQTMIHSSGGDVWSSNDISCAAGGRRARPGAAGLALLVVSAMLIARSRRRRDRME